jgi:hypothetical protein
MLQSIANSEFVGEPQIIKGYIADDATSPNDEVEAMLPTRNDPCVVALDEDDNAVLLSWWSEDPTSAADRVTQPELDALDTRLDAIEGRAGPRGWGRFACTSITAGAGTLGGYYPWDAADSLTDTALYQRITPSGRPTLSSVQVKAAGWYRVRASVLTNGTAGTRLDAMLRKEDATGALIANLDWSLDTATPDAFAKQVLGAEYVFALNDCLTVLCGSTARPFGNTDPWSWIELRYLGV